jgi:hypothetical protein
MKFVKEDFVNKHGFYYVGHIIEVDGNAWVDEEQLELILLELNAGVTDNVIFEVPNRKDVIWIPMFGEETNYIHLN